ncbi:MAG TPA: type VI secretion system protein, partial [Anaeromyxobacteraceae bacterium]|nr:type VI secretion system protein [Anaeromyxobacteraceae bacterium]
PPEEGALALLGAAPAPESLRRALDGLRVLDPACGGGSLLAAAATVAGRIGARLSLAGMEVSPLAARAARLRLALLAGGRDGGTPRPGRVRRADALSARWPACDLLLANPPFLRHEAMPPAWKDRASRRSGLSRQADLSAHLVLLALRAAPVCALVLPRALEVSRSAAPLREEAARRGGFAVRLRSRAAGSFAASVETELAVWVEGGASRPAVEARVALGSLAAREVAAVAAGRGSARVRRTRPATPARASLRTVGEVARVRFGMKSGANGFFHLVALGGGRYRGVLLGEVALEPGDVAPLLAGLRDARAPEVVQPSRLVFRPADPSPAALDYVRRGEAHGLHLRPSCASRREWWRLAPGRQPAPVLYPAKVGSRAFAVHNRGGLLEDKKWHALHPLAVEPWLLAALLSSTPLRLAVERGARQLTGAQAIADIDCGVLAAAPWPDDGPLARAVEAVRAAWAELARDPVSTDLGAMLARPAQRALDHSVGAALGMTPAAVEGARRDLLLLSTERGARAEQVRAAIRGAGRARSVV